MTGPFCIDLFCGLGGWAEGFLAEGYEVIGFDIEKRPYPGQLVLQDVRTLHGAQFRNATCIVASPPCQEYSYRAMPWKRAKALPPPSNELFEACFRIQRETSEAAGHYIPMVIENVCGAQKWVGSARWHFGSYYLWGDVPAIMPFAVRAAKVPGQDWNKFKSNGEGSPWWNGQAQKIPIYSDPRRNGGKGVHLTSPWENSDGLKFGGGWCHDATNNLIRKASSRSGARRTASAMIAKIPFDLAQHIARTFKTGEKPKT
jgi:hypothetical protein